MISAEIQSAIAAIENNAALYEETSFDSRADAIDELEFAVIDRIEGLLQAAHPPAELIALRQHAERVKRQLEDIDATLFQQIRADLRAGRYTGAALKRLIATYTGRDADTHRRQDELGYDSRDLFINGLLLTQALPEETKAREPEMVYYQQTPARIIFQLVEQAQLTAHDLFYDLGSGLGHVPILVSLLSGARATGVEFQPSYCAYARACAADLNLPGVTFIQADARTVDLAAGTVFFMYTPFTGSILQTVLDKLRDIACARTIRIFTYGPCTALMYRQSWLKGAEYLGDPLYTLGLFSSL